jgi:glyoxylase-like metal-dependent hydrolase (beta-lactamase superfamily II)
VQLIFEQIRVGGDRNFGYLLADRDAGHGVLIDPSYAPEAIVARARDQRIEILHVVNTHGHDDHVNGNDAAIALTGAGVAAHPAAGVPPAVPLADGRELVVGSLRLRVFHTPGHCPDHIVIYEPAHRLLVTGDLLFVGKVGGTADERDARTEWDSLQRVLAEVPDEATVWPGHDYGVRPSSTIGLERLTNPFLRCAGVDDFLRLRAGWADFKKQHGLK